MNTQQAETARSAFKRAVEIAGGKAALADLIKVRPQAVYLWDVVPIRRVVQVYKATGRKVPLEDLRPDFYLLED